MLSISVAAVLHILVGHVIVGNMLHSSIVSMNACVFLWTLLLSKSMLWSIPAIQSNFSFFMRLVNTSNSPTNLVVSVFGGQYRLQTATGPYFILSSTTQLSAC